MSDEKTTPTTNATWQDKHSGLRRHKLMTKELGATIPALYANEKVQKNRRLDGLRQAVLSLQTAGAGTSPSGRLRPACCFGLIEGFETEWGYFELTELAETTVFGRVPAIERDLYWKPKTIGEIRRESAGRIAA